jgi:hypothetical protein
MVILQEGGNPQRGTHLLTTMDVHNSRSMEEGDGA